jgi:YggT family protein
MTFVLVNAINWLVQIFSLLILIEIIMSWVMVANIRLPDPVIRLLQMITSINGVILNPIRRLIPNMGGFDLSPIIALLLLDVLRRLLVGALLR